MPFKHTIIASGLMLLGMLFLNYTNHSEDIYPNKPFSKFPKQINQWQGDEKRFEQKIYDILGVDDSILCNYSTKDGRHIQLYIGFYQSQREGDLIHSPKNCMPGAGWNIVRTDLRKIKRSKGDEVNVIELTLQNGPKQQAMLYWFHSRGRIISSEYMQKIYLIIDSVLRHRTDGSFVRLIAPISPKNPEKAFQELTKFAEQIMPILDEYIPR